MNRSAKMTVEIRPIPDHPDRYLATFSSEVLDSTFAVVFPETVAGAVALHTFAEMIRKEYGDAVEISIPQGVPLAESSPVHDLLFCLEGTQVKAKNTSTGP